MSSSVEKMIAQGVTELDARVIAEKWKQREANGEFVVKGFYYRLPLPNETLSRSGEIRLIDAW